MQKCDMDKAMINIGSKNYKKWVRLKEQFKFKTDTEFADCLLQWTEKHLCLTKENEEYKVEINDQPEKKPSLTGRVHFIEENSTTIVNEEDAVERLKLELNITSSEIIRICPLCGIKHNSGFCPVETPLVFVPDSTVLENIKEEYAKSSLPASLELRKLDMGEGIFALSEIQRYTEFGPLIGIPIKEMAISDDNSMKNIWEIKSGSYISTLSTANSNWLRWIRPAPLRSKRNIVPVVKENKIFFVTISTVKKHEELLYWSDMKGPWAMKKMEKTNCGGCNMQFDHAMYYRLHCVVFHDASLSLTVRKYHCKVCGEVVLGKKNIIKHALLYHNGKGAYQCQFCLKFFLRLNYLEMHKNYGCSANPKRARPLCDYCGRKFCQPQKLKVHIKRMHSDISEVLKEFQCPSCRKLLGSRAALQRHTKEVHMRPSCVSCTKCSKSFQNKSNLKIHMLTHSGVKPFKCQESNCRAAFTTKQCLQFHYKKVHGLSEDRYPNIVRSVDYTFASYSGAKDRFQEENSSSENELHSADEKDQIEKTSDESDESIQEENKKSVEKEDNYKKDEMYSKPEPSNASLLVEAALRAAEKGIRPNSDVTHTISSPEAGCPPVYKSHFRNPPLEYTHAIRHLDASEAQSLIKYKYDEEPTEAHDGLEPRYPVYDYQQDIVKAVNLQSDLSLQRTQLINLPQLTENERILPNSYQPNPSYISTKSPTYNHHSIYN